MDLTPMTTAFNIIKSDWQTAVGLIAAIGCAVMGIRFVWKFGIRIFKGLSK